MPHGNLFERTLWKEGSKYSQPEKTRKKTNNKVLWLLLIKADWAGQSVPVTGAVPK